ncbi:uncharacterized protein [Nicotiana sylvestris]
MKLQFENQGLLELNQCLKVSQHGHFCRLEDMGLLKAVSKVLPKSEHRWCARHILANWSKDWRGLERRNSFSRCARASCVAELNFHLDSLNMLGNGICESLLRYNKETWCRAYFNCDRKCDIIDNNMCETFNAWILAARHKTIITMLEEIRVKMMERIGKLREFADTWICDISPIAMKVYQDNIAQSMRCTIKWNGEYDYEVEDTSLRVVLKHCVNMQAQTCTCRSWMLKGIPCAHAIAAMHFKNLDPINYISHWYHKSTYLKAYSTFIQPVSNMQMWPTSTNPPIEPPPIKKMPGRPKKKRRREETEHPTSGKLSRRGMEMTCSNYGGYGHNKRSCPKKARPVDSTPANASYIQRCGGKGRGRGRARGTGTPTTSAPTIAGRGRRTAASKGRETGSGRGSSGFGLFQSSSGFTSFSSGRGKPRVVSHGGEKRSSTDILECAYKPRSGVKWNGRPTITRRQLERTAATRSRTASSQSNLSQASSSSQNNH